MPTDLLDQISAINPLPEDVTAPPIASLPTLPAPPGSDPSPGPTRARSPFPRRTLLAAPIAAVVLGLALLGRGGGRFDAWQPPSTRRRWPAPASTSCSWKAKPGP